MQVLFAPDATKFAARTRGASARRVMHKRLRAKANRLGVLLLSSPEPSQPKSIFLFFQASLHRISCGVGVTAGGPFAPLNGVNSRTVAENVPKDNSLPQDWSENRFSYILEFCFAKGEERL